MFSTGGDGHRRKKIGLIEEAYLPGMSVSLVARRYRINGIQVFTCRRLMTQGALTAAGTGEEAVPVVVLSEVFERNRCRRRCFAALAAKGGKPDQLVIDATHLKTHRTAASLLKKRLFSDVSDALRAV